MWRYKNESDMSLLPEKAKLKTDNIAAISEQVLFIRSQGHRKFPTLGSWVAGCRTPGTWSFSF
jgi:hypothetical protein